MVPRTPHPAPQLPHRPGTRSRAKNAAIAGQGEESDPCPAVFMSASTSRGAQTARTASM